MERRSAATRRSALHTLALLVAVTSDGCAAIGGIFKAGFWVGVIVAALAVVVVLFFVRSISR